MSPLMAEIPEIVSEPPIIDRLVLHIWPTRRPDLAPPPSALRPPSVPLLCSAPVIPMRAMTEIRDDVFFVAVILATQIGTQYRQKGRPGGGGKRTDVDDLSSSFIFRQFHDL